jgi:transcription elongation factor GreA
MTDTLSGRISEMINEEKWTRADLSGYSTSSFKTLDELLEEMLSADAQDEAQEEIQEICEEHLQNSRDSVIGLYLSGILALSKRIVDDSNLVVLTNMFVDGEKWNIVEYLCERILHYGENKFALRTLAETYGKKNDHEHQHKILERLIKVDYEDADTVRNLGDKREQEGDLDGALDYHKKALHRYINRRQFSQIKQLWEKLIELQPEDFEGLMQIENKVVQALGGDRAITLLELLYPYYREKEDWDASVDILKRILNHDPRKSGARAELVDVYTSRYAGHSHLEEYIKVSNLNQSWRNVHDAIADFEKHISFDEGNYVFHRTWGIGRIKEIKDDRFAIDFLKKRGHHMSLKMAVNALNILHSEHIWVLRATVPREKLKTRVKEDPAWALRTVIRSFANDADMKRVKAELVPRILPPNEWSKWSTAARRILKTDSAFGTVAGKLDHYSVRARPISFEEKTYNKFRADKNFFSRVQTLHEFLDHAQAESEYLAEMFEYFAGFLKASSGQIENNVASFLIIEKLTGKYPHLDPGVRVGFRELFVEIDDLEEVFQLLDGAGLDKDFLTYIRNDIGAWAHIYARIFLFHPTRPILDELASSEHTEVVAELIASIVDDYREHRQPFVWLVRNDPEDVWFQRHGIKPEKVMIGMIHLLDLTYRDIGNRREVPANRKLNRQIFDYLFKERQLAEFISTANEESITRIYTLVEDVKELDPSIKIRIRQRIKEKFPAYKFANEAEKDTVRMGLLVTRFGYEDRQRELRHILEVDIPENSKEIGLALQKGDLRENAEYKAALERQEHLKGAVSRLQEDLQNAQIFDLAEANASGVSFGTEVELTNIDSNTKERYVILGPWESDPKRNIISYLSPLGAELWRRRTNDELQFTINEKRFHYRIERIAKVKQQEVATRS